jgi:hypothetical protein
MVKRGFSTSDIQVVCSLSLMSLHLRSSLGAQYSLSLGDVLLISRSRHCSAYETRSVPGLASIIPRTIHQCSDRRWISNEDMTIKPPGHPCRGQPPSEEIPMTWSLVEKLNGAT